MRKNVSLGLLVKLFVFIIALMAVYTQYTDADLFDKKTVGGNTFQATTLDFSTNDTANDTKKSLFFSVSGMIPHGFQVESVRIKKTGDQPFSFTLSSQKTAGEDALCQNLNVKILENWTEVSAGTLGQIGYTGTLTETDQYKDFVFVISLDSADHGLAGKSCAFNFIFNTPRDQSNKFYATKILQNTIETGTWAE